MISRVFSTTLFVSLLVITQTNNLKTAAAEPSPERPTVIGHIIPDVECLAIPIVRIGFHENPITDICFSPDGELLCLAAQNESFSIWKRNEETVYEFFAQPERTLADLGMRNDFSHYLSCSQDLEDTYVITTLDLGSRIISWRVMGRAFCLTRQIPIFPKECDHVFGYEESEAYLTMGMIKDDIYGVTLLDQDGKHIETVPLGTTRNRTETTGRFGPDGNWCLYRPKPNRVQIYILDDFMLNDATKNLLSISTTDCFGLSPDGNMVVSAAKNGIAAVLEKDSKGQFHYTQTDIIPSPESYMRAIAISPGNIILACGFESGSVILYKPKIYKGKSKQTKELFNKQKNLIDGLFSSGAHKNIKSTKLSEIYRVYKSDLNASSSSNLANWHEAFYLFEKDEQEALSRFFNIESE